MEFRVLGLLEVVENALRIDLPGEKIPALLGMLLVQPNEVVSADRLADGLWGYNHPPSASNSVQGYVSRLRKALGADHIQTRSPGYVLVVDPAQIDAVRSSACSMRGARPEWAANRSEPSTS